MRVDVVTLPRELRPEHLKDRSVVVFDVLRATTSIITALAAGAKEVRVFGSLDSASKAAGEYALETRLLCGEHQCVAPAGFDLGNSPREFVAGRVSGKTIFLSTTNGTRAIVASRKAARLFAAALVNATAMAGTLSRVGRDVTLLCAGTNGELAPEDMIGAGAVAAAMQHIHAIATNRTADQAISLFRAAEKSLPTELRKTQGGKNIMAAGLDPDIDFAAQLDLFDIVGEVGGEAPIVKRMIES